MTEVAPWEDEGRSDRLFIHFDVEGHFLKLDTFIQTAESAREIIAAIDQTFFKGELKYELIVLPPDDGSFLTKFGVLVAAGTAAFGILNTDIGAAYVEGLTGKAPVEWAKELGQDHRVRVQDAYEMIEPREEPSQETTQPTPPSPTSTKSESDQAACRTSAKIIVAMARGVLEKETDELNRIGMNVGNLFDALDARAKFYSACIKDSDVSRIGFTPDDEFPIPRKSFPERAQKPTPPDIEEDPSEWAVAIESIYVTSPNWDEEDQKTRQWKGKDQIRRDCYFVIEDAEFWGLVKVKSLHVEVLDNLKVQWAYQIKEGRPKNRRVLRVLEFNGDKLADPLMPDAIRAVLGSFSAMSAPRGEPTLFDDRD